MYDDSWGSLEELSQPEDNIYFAFTLLYKLVLFYFYSDYHWLYNTSYHLTVAPRWDNGLHSGVFAGHSNYVDERPDGLGSRLSKN